jgi:hypothetical protein
MRDLVLQAAGALAVLVAIATPAFASESARRWIIAVATQWWAFDEMTICHLILR